MPPTLRHLTSDYDCWGKHIDPLAVISEEDFQAAGPGGMLEALMENAAAGLFGAVPGVPVKDSGKTGHIVYAPFADAVIAPFSAAVRIVWDDGATVPYDDSVELAQ